MNAIIAGSLLFMPSASGVYERLVYNSNALLYTDPG